jgi:hypothetical protein
MKTCSICDRPHSSRGYCDVHCQRLRRAGKMAPLPKITAEQRFWSKVDKSGDCWVWTGSTFEPEGYGLFHLTVSPGKYRSRTAHTFSFEIANGPVPPGFKIDHRCRNRLCVRPDHLRQATTKQNAENLGGANSASKTGVRGVSWDGRRGKYRARVMHHRKFIEVGSFKTLAEAAEAVRLKRIELFTHNDADRIAS